MFRRAGPTLGEATMAGMEEVRVCLRVPGGQETGVLLSASRLTSTSTGGTENTQVDRKNFS